jgi:flagellar hook-associated protein 1 FlgK
MGTGLYSIGVSGLTAAQLGLLATSHNITNANTPGYTRQATVQATNIAINTGAGAIGQGVHVETIKRLYDQFVTDQVNSAQTQVSELDSYYTQIKQIDSLLADATAGLSPALQAFFSGAQQVASDPSQLPARQSMISSAETLVERFQMLDSRLVGMNDEINGRLVDTVAQINTYASLIADVNQKIVVAQSSYGQPPNDLLDQRDQMVNELNKLIKVSTTSNSDGSYNVFIGSGQQLVVGSTCQEMTAKASAADPTRIAIGIKTAAGAQELPEYLITGGQLGGLLSFRSESLDAVSNEIGRVAASFALTVNAQHSLGQDLLGQIAGDSGFVGNIFTLSAPKITANAFNSGSGSLTASFSAPNAPSGPTFSGNFSTDLTPSDYQVTFGAGGAYTVTRLSDNQSVASGVGAGTVTFDGLTLDIAVVGNNGDKFKLQPFSEIARNIAVDSRISADPRLIAAAAPVQVTEGVANTGSLKISQGVVGVGYTAPAAGSPIALSVDSTSLQGVPGAWTAVYSDGTQVPGSGDISLLNGTATLASFSFNNMSFEVTGSPPTAGSDTFSLQRNTSGVQDGRNAVLFANLQTQNTTAGGTATYQSAYARIVADNGIRTREAKVQLDAQTAVLDQAQATRESLSGVNLDEEAANMIKYQQAYQASSKILEIGNKLFDTILALG